MLDKTFFAIIIYTNNAEQKGPRKKKYVLGLPRGSFTSFHAEEKSVETRFFRMKGLLTPEV